MPRNGVFGAPNAARFATALAAAAAATGLVAVAGSAGTGGAHGEPAAAGFRLADGTVACALVDGALACRADGADTAAVLERDGRSRAADVDVPHDASTPVLLRAESWWLGGFSCRVVAESVVCRAGDGAITVAPGVTGGVR